MNSNWSLVYEQCIVPLLFQIVTLHSVLDCAVNSALSVNSASAGTVLNSNLICKGGS